jgi:phospholipid/cholesterol/gamma-HCH transport system substrate-binding protein
MRAAIRKRAKDFAAIVVLVLLSGVVAVYVLGHERLRFPFVQAGPVAYKAAFSTAQAVTPGQGQSVRVSGVQVGEIGSVELSRGQAIVTMEIDPKYKHLIHTNATALLRPKTGLKDMFIELDPGTGSAPMAKPGWTLPVGRTQPDVNLDEVLSVLDSDTRSYLQLLVNGAGEGLAHRGGDLAEVFRRFEPTLRDLSRFSTAVVTRQRDLRHLVTSLDRLNGALAQRRADLGPLVDSS